MAKDKLLFLTGYAFVLFLVGVTFLLILSAVPIAVVNGLFFGFRNERLLVVWIVAVLALAFGGSLAVALRHTLSKIDGEHYFPKRR